MFWRKSDRDILEAPRSSEGRKLDARSYEPLPDQDAIAAEAAAREARQAEEEAASAYTDRFDDALIRLTDTSEKAGNILLAFFLRQEAKRRASAQGDRVGLTWLAALILTGGIIGTWIFGASFWVIAAMAAFFAFLTQIGEEYAGQDYSGVDPATLPGLRRVAIFFHSSFATSEGTARNLCVFAAFALMIAVIVAFIL